ncbi:hypothetical protein F4774DRAFT_427095 [Daldinia eschscholtzii]|nr:hypothetical protein F4774DRAFT_427095 [Daldinia eschscholtzii]
MPPLILRDFRWFNRNDMLRPLYRILGRHLADKTDIETASSIVVLTDAIEAHMLERVGNWDNWDGSGEEDCIWIETPHMPIGYSQNTLVAMHIVSLSANNNIPCLFYFNSLTTRPNEGPQLTRWALMMDMLRSIVVQLLLILPREIYTDIDLSTSRFEKLAETSASLHDSLALLRDVRAHVGDKLYCVIEGVQKIDEPNDLAHSAALEAILLEFRSHISLLVSNASLGSHIPRKTVKACFTSDGPTTVLEVMERQGQVVKIQGTGYANIENFSYN